MSSFFCVYLIWLAIALECQGKWVQIRLDLPSPGEPDHNLEYRPLKQDHIKILDEEGNALPKEGEEEEGFSSDELEVEIDLEKEGQGHGRDKGGSQKHDGRDSGTGAGKGGSYKHDGKDGNGNKGGEHGGGHGHHHSAEEELPHHAVIHPLHKVTRKPTTTENPVGRDYNGRSSGEVVNCPPTQKPYPDPINPKFYYMCAEMGNNTWHEIKLKCPLGVFEPNEQVCRWERPLPEEPTADECKSEEQMIPSPSDPKCYYYCIKDDGKENAQFELVLECVEEKSVPPKKKPKT